MGIVTWLHLSDLHFIAGAEFESFNQKVVLDALWDDVRHQVVNGLKPDFIIFTGDVAYHGKQDEYDLARDLFFEPLLIASGLTKDRLFVIPGNHDIDWSEMDPIVSAGMGKLLTNRDQINQFLSSSQQRSFAFTKFRAFAAFMDSYFGKTPSFSDGHYFSVGVVETLDHSHKIGVLGLNSGWMSACVRDAQGSALDQGNLFVGERQLDEALKELGKSGKVDLLVACLHHPVDWLNQDDRFRIERQLATKCDFVLHGHWHEQQVKIVQSLDGQVVYIPAGAVYAQRDYPNGYNIVQVDLRSRKAKVHLRRYNDQRTEWTKDIFATGEEGDGKVELSLSKRVLGEESLDAPMNSRKILLVENDPVWQEIVQSILIAPDFMIRTAISYAEARSLLQTSFDVIIVNLCLHGDSDFEGVALLEALGDRVPCIVLTGSATSTRGLYERYGIFEVFVKGRTFNRAEFLATVKRALSQPIASQTPERAWRVLGD